MKHQFFNAISSELNDLLFEILAQVPGPKREKIKVLFSEKIEKLRPIFLEKRIFARFRDGHVEQFPSIREASQSLNYSQKTLECELSKGKGSAIFKKTHLEVSWFPLAETTGAPTEEPGYWVRKLDGTIHKFETIDEAAKLCNLQPQSLRTYLSTGKGKTTTKLGMVSTSPIQPLNEAEAFALNFFNRNGRWPEDHETPKFISFGKRK